MREVRPRSQERRLLQGDYIELHMRKGYTAGGAESGNFLQIRNVSMYFRINMVLTYGTAICCYAPSSAQKIDRYQLS
jgi:hypothetical protein